MFRVKDKEGIEDPESSVFDNAAVIPGNE